MVIPSPIRSCIAALLLLVFALANTPKRTLHDFVANHRDGSAKTTGKALPGESITRASFNCQCDNLVCTSSFIAETSLEYTFAAPVFSLELSITASSHLSSTSISYGLRGPPVV